jgi:hypothetical protein
MNAAVEQGKRLNSLRRDPHDLERDPDAHGMSREREARRRYGQRTLGHRGKAVAWPEVDDLGRCDVGKTRGLRLPDRAVAKQARQKQQIGHCICFFEIRQEIAA